MKAKCGYCSYFCSYHLCARQTGLHICKAATLHLPRYFNVFKVIKSLILFCTLRDRVYKTTLNSNDKYTINLLFMGIISRHL